MVELSPLKETPGNLHSRSDFGVEGLSPGAMTECVKKGMSRFALSYVTCTVSPCSLHCLKHGTELAPLPFLSFQPQHSTVSVPPREPDMSGRERTTCY